MNLTVFAGTFNPIHTGHLILAESARTELNLDKVLFIPSHVPPHRENGIASAVHRLEMVRLAVANNSAFDVSDIEHKLDGKSYTLKTINCLYELYPNIDGKINFIIGTDAFLNIESWYKSEELVKLVNFLILTRKGTPEAENIVNNIRFKDIDYTILETPIIEISSSYVRERIQAGKSIKYLVSDSVEAYIREYRLFS